MKAILGAHMSIAKGFPAAADRAHEELDANAMQIFLKSPRSSASKPLSDEDTTSFRNKCQQYGIEFVIGHASYLLNFAKPQDAKDPWQFNNIFDDLEKLGRLGGYGLVYHVGKSLQLNEDAALDILYQNLSKILDFAAKNNVKLLLENCAGQGSEIGTKLETIATILNKMDSNYLEVCLDTCHAFAAGYDLSTVASVKAFFAKIENTIGLNKVACFHFNDSKFKLSSNKDRHDNLGKGQIGQQGLTALAKQAASHHKPIILETPLVKDSHKGDLDLLRSWLKG